MTRRTTAAAIDRAIRAAREAGLPVAAVEVQSGGVVRIRRGLPEASNVNRLRCNRRALAP